MISGKPVTEDTSVTSTPFARSSIAVPPVESRVTPLSRSERAKSRRPSLFETLSSARRMVVLTARVSGTPRSRGDSVGAKLLAQRAAVDAEDLGRAALVTVGVVERRP